MEIQPAYTMPCWKLRFMASGSEGESAKHIYPNINSKQLELWLIGANHTLPVSQSQTATSYAQVSLCFRCRTVNRNTLVVLLLERPMEAKERWIDLFYMHLIRPALNVDVIWASIAIVCYRKQFQPDASICKDQSLHSLRCVVMPPFGYSGYTRDEYPIWLTPTVMHFSNSDNSNFPMLSFAGVH